MAQAPSAPFNKSQMNAAIASSRVPGPEMTAGRFGRIGLPAVAAAAEVVKAKRKPEKPVHLSIYQHFVD